MTVSESDAPYFEKEINALPTFESFATSLLSDPEIAKLPEDEQGDVIIDRFAGAVVRRGEIQGSVDTYTPRNILDDIDRVSTGGVDALRQITNTDGLRKAVFALSQDKRVGALFGRFSNRVHSEKDGSLTLTSPAQLEGYFTAGGRQNYVSEPVGGVHMHGDSWIPVVMEHTQRMAENEHLGWMTSAQARDLMKSSSPLLKNTGRDWNMARASAEKVGIDMNLVGRSAEKIQSRANARDEMGSTALFMSTDIQRYRDDLDRRSGY